MGKKPGKSAYLALPLKHDSNVPLFRQLYESLRQAILSGHLAARTRLPSTRILAQELGLSRKTVMTAFEQLLVEGYLDGKVGSGTFVASRLPERMLNARWSGNLGATSPAAPLFGPRRLSRMGEHFARTRLEAGLVHSGPLPFCPALPAVDEFPMEAWGRIMNRRWRKHASSFLGYGQMAGYRPLREAIASYVTTSRAVRCTPENVIVVNGSQQGLDLCARVLLDPNDEAWVEDPGYLGCRTALMGVGARLVPVPVDEEGLNVQHGMARALNARIACVSPSHQYPLGVTMSLPRRLALLDWASRQGSWVVEDDYDSEYRYSSRPLASLQGMDGDSRVIYIGTFSKVVYPSLRLGYIIVPSDLVDAFLGARSSSDRHPPVLEQATLTDFITEGLFASHIRRMRELYASRQESLRSALKEYLGDVVKLGADDAGMHMVGWLPPDIDAKAVSAQAEARRVEAIPLASYSMEARHNGLVLGFASLIDSEVKRGTQLLTEAIAAATPR